MLEHRQPLERRRAWVMAALGVSLTGLLGLAWLLDIGPYHPPARPLRIGIWNGPPMEIWRADHSVGGLGPDVINEAARRAGIRLEWVNPKAGPEELLPTGQLDLWGNLSVTPRRRGLFFLTNPWSENIYGLVSLSSNLRAPKDVIGAIDSPVATYMSRRVRPNEE